MSYLYKQLVGIDIQSGCIRFAQAKRKKARYQLERVFKSDLPADIFEEGRIKRWDKLQNQLSELVEVYDLKSLPMAFSIPFQWVHHQQILLPKKISASEALFAIRKRIEDELATTEHQLLIDFSPIDNSANDGSMQHYQYVAARKEQVMQYVDCFKGAHLLPCVADVEIYAMANALQSIAHESSLRAFLVYEYPAAFLLILDHEKMIYQKQWESHDMQSVGNQLIMQWQLFEASFPYCSPLKLELVGSAADTHSLQFLLEEKKWGTSVACLNEQLLGVSFEFLIAMGLSMRVIDRDED